MTNPTPNSGPSYAKKRIGLLGGSFNPAHEGHLAMALHALKRLSLDEVWWLVSPQNPLKPVAGMAPFEKRLADTKKLAKHPRFVVTAIEVRLGTRYTVDTLRALKRHFPATQFVWLMGADNLGQMPRWRQWQKIFAMVPVAVFRRPGYALHGKVVERFARYRVRNVRGLAAMKPPAWLVLDNRLNLLSGTEIRSRLSRRPPPAKSKDLLKQVQDFATSPARGEEPNGECGL
jgi:nicotinate-nucleotide adenylyltransferase